MQTDAHAHTAVQHQLYRGHSFAVEAVGSDDSWQGRHQIDFMHGPAQGHTLGARNAISSEPCWATQAEALAYATEQAYAAIDAYSRLEHEMVAMADTGLRDQRLTVRYSLLAEDGVERQHDCMGMMEASRFIGGLGTSLRHAFVLDAAGTTLIEAGIDDRNQRGLPNHADWPQID